LKKITYIPVLVLTALQDDATRIHALASGAQDFLTKPFDKDRSINKNTKYAQDQALA